MNVNDVYAYTVDPDDLSIEILYHDRLVTSKDMLMIFLDTEASVLHVSIEYMTNTFKRAKANELIAYLEDNNHPVPDGMYKWRSLGSGDRNYFDNRPIRIAPKVLWELFMGAEGSS